MAGPPNGIGAAQARMTARAKPAGEPLAPPARQARQKSTRRPTFTLRPGSGALGNTVVVRIEVAL